MSSILTTPRYDDVIVKKWSTKSNYYICGIQLAAGCGARGVEPLFVNIEAIMKFRTFAALILLLGAQSAWADLIFNIDTGNSALSGNTGPFAQVDVSLTDTTHATITFTSLTNSGNIYLLGDGGSVDVNVNGTFTLGTISGSNAGTGFTPGPYSDSGSGNVDGWGTFNQTITSFDGFTHSSDTISFGLTATGSTTWATAADVLTPNANNALAAAHIFVTSSPANAANGAIVTGFAAGNNGGGPPNNIPEPGTVALIGVSLVGLTLMKRKGAKA
jgi:hypothetical protein